MMSEKFLAAAVKKYLAMKGCVAGAVEVRYQDKQGIERVLIVKMDENGSLEEKCFVGRVANLAEVIGG